MVIASMPPGSGSKAAGGWVGARHLLSVPVAPLSLECVAFAALPSEVESSASVSFLQLSAIDVSARTTMKGAAKCDKHCELQDSVNQ